MAVAATPGAVWFTLPRVRNNATSTAIIDSAAFRTAVRECVAHYHAERNHHGLEGRLIAPQINTVAAGPIVCRERVGGLLRFYHRQQPEHVTGGSGPIVYCERLGRLIRFYHQQAP